MSSTEPQRVGHLPVATTRRTLEWVGGNGRRRWRACVAAVLLGLFTGICAVIPLLALGALIDRVTDHADVSSLVPIIAIAGLSAALGGLIAGVTARTIARLGADILADVRLAAVVTALRLPREMIERAGRGDVLSRMNNDVTAANRAVTMVLPNAVIACCLTLVTIAAMAGLDWRLGLAGALAIPFYVWAVRWYLPRSGPVYADERRAAAVRAQVMLETINSRNTIHAYAIDDAAIDRVRAASLASRDRAITAFRLFTRLVGRANRAEFVGLTAVLVVGFWLVSTAQVTVGAVTAAALLFHRLFNPIGMVLYSFADLQLAAAGLARLIGVADVPVPASDAASASSAPSGVPSLQGVQFGYRTDRPVLRAVDLALRPGRTVALVGASGAGKSTVAALLAGSLVPDVGQVHVPAGTRMVLLSQETHVFAGPLIDDLRLAAPDADRDRIDAALAATHSLRWVQALPDGIDTVVGDGGHPLDEVAAQQIALTRLILADPDVVILDEATAEAGSRSAGDLDDAARTAIRGRTALVIAHRLGQIHAADWVVVMDRGAVVEQGPPDELLAAGGALSRAWAAWDR